MNSFKILQSGWLEKIPIFHHFKRALESNMYLLQNSQTFLLRFLLEFKEQDRSRKIRRSHRQSLFNQKFNSDLLFLS